MLGGLSSVVQVEAIEELIRLGCPIAVRDQQLWLTPLHVAASEGHMAAVKHLLSKVTCFSRSSAPCDLPRVICQENEQVGANSQGALALRLWMGQKRFGVWGFNLDM